LAIITSARSTANTTLLTRAVMIESTSATMDSLWDARKSEHMSVMKDNPAAIGWRIKMTSSPCRTSFTMSGEMAVKAMICSGTAYPSRGPKHSPSLVNNVGGFRAPVAHTPQTPNLSSVATELGT